MTFVVCVPAARPLGLTETVSVAGVCPVVGFTVSQVALSLTVKNAGMASLVVS